jgi:hypothetical protein
MLPSHGMATNSQGEFNFSDNGGNYGPPFIGGAPIPPNMMIQAQLNKGSASNFSQDYDQFRTI